MMDIASEIMKPDIHEKCLHASGKHARRNYILT